MQRVTSALASMKLAVVMMVALSVICAWATVYESKHGTPAAQREFYGTGWFSLMLVLLGLNILFSMFKRYPWKTQHAGFLAAHVGIVLLLGGSLVSLHYGLDSSMALYEGDTTDRIELPEKALQVALPGHAAHGTFPAAFEKNPPKPGRERRFKIGGSDATLVVEEFAPHVVLSQSAVAGRQVTPATPPAKHGRQMPAVKLRLETRSQSSPSEWLVWGESQEVPTSGGVALLAYRPPQLQVPFRVTLLKFQSEKYPGSNMAATYESSVRIDDPERGVSEHPISMNRPLHYRGYIFFQSSFVEGAPMMSIFSVTRAPGLPLVYLGVALITGGVAWMFYLKPYLARRQGAAALAARRPALRAALGAAPVRGQA